LRRSAITCHIFTPNIKKRGKRKKDVGPEEERKEADPDSLTGEGTIKKKFFLRRRGEGKG